MKVAKTLALFAVFILAFVCFGAPMVNAADEHPWDEESPVSPGQNSVNPDEDDGDGDGTTQTRSMTDPDGSYGYTEFIIDVQLTIIYKVSFDDSDVQENQVESLGDN